MAQIIELEGQNDGPKKPNEYFSNNDRHYCIENLKIFLEKCFSLKKIIKDTGFIIFQSELTFSPQLPSISVQVQIDQLKRTFTLSFFFHFGVAITICRTKQLKILIIKELNNFIKYLLPSEFILVVDSHSGLISGKQAMKIPYSKTFTLYYCQILENLKLKAKIFFPALLHLLNQISETKLSRKHQSKILQYEALYSKYTRIPSIYLKEENLLQSIVNNSNTQLKVPIKCRKKDDSDLKTTILFSTISYKEQGEEDVELEMKEKNKLLNSLRPPTLNFREGFLFNSLRIHKTLSGAIDLKIAGGLSKIILQKLSVEFISPSEEEAGLVNLEDPVNKLLAIKVAKNSENERRFLEKTKHELKILSKLKKVSSNFIAQHYSANQKDFQFSKHVMTDFMDSETLNYFLLRNSQTLSWKSKIYLLIGIASGIRVLENSEIVHMDLSPSNILICKGLMTKIIDFGESYHEDVCGENYQPGYTLPFTSPERFKGRKKPISSACDMFSFGVLVFYTMMNTFPLPTSDTIIPFFKDSKYSSRFFFAHENLEDCGYSRIFEKIFKIVSRCMDPNPSLRLSPKLCILLLKELYFHIQQFFYYS